VILSSPCNRLLYELFQPWFRFSNHLITSDRAFFTGLHFDDLVGGSTEIVKFVVITDADGAQESQIHQYRYHHSCS